MSGNILSEDDIKTLEKQLKDLHREIADDLNKYSRKIQQPVDKNLIDAIPENEDKEIVELEDSREEDQIHMVEEALQRIAENSYGCCFDCGVNISLERLHVIPYAKFCVKCEEMRKNT